MLEELIIIENGKEKQCKSLEELVKTLISENYYEISKEEQAEKIKMRAIANTLNNRMEISEETDENSLENKFIIKDEITYILSLISTNKIVLLERKDADIFTKNLNKQKIEDNYIIVNKFARDLLKEYVKNKI